LPGTSKQNNQTSRECTYPCPALPPSIPPTRKERAEGTVSADGCGGNGACENETKFRVYSKIKYYVEGFSVSGGKIAFIEKTVDYYRPDAPGSFIIFI
jgi:hypothetical protein